MWAGDSRVYVLYEKGLLQMTVDDLDVSDAMKNLSADGALTNVISSDGNYEVHGKIIGVRTTCIDICSHRWMFWVSQFSYGIRIRFNRLYDRRLMDLQISKIDFVKSLNSMRRTILLLEE